MNEIEQCCFTDIAWQRGASQKILTMNFYQNYNKNSVRDIIKSFGLYFLSKRRKKWTCTREELRCRPEMSHIFLQNAREVGRRRLGCWITLYLSGTLQRQGVDVEFSLDGVQGVELDVEEEEDESVQSWTQTITQTSDSCDHPLDHTCRGRKVMLLETCYCWHSRQRCTCNAVPAKNIFSNTNLSLKNTQ